MALSEKVNRNTLDPDIYLPLVDALFKERGTLLIGTGIMTSAILATYFKTGEPILLVCTIVCAVLGLVRMAHMRAYELAHEAIVTVSQARRWELEYVVGASVSVASLGMWAYFSFALTDDAYAHLVSFTMTIGYVIGIFGRN